MRVYFNRPGKLDHSFSQEVVLHFLWHAAVNNSSTYVHLIFLYFSGSRTLTAPSLSENTTPTRPASTSRATICPWRPRPSRLTVVVPSHYNQILCHWLQSSVGNHTSVSRWCGDSFHCSCSEINVCCYHSLLGFAFMMCEFVAKMRAKWIHQWINLSHLFETSHSS